LIEREREKKLDDDDLDKKTSRFQTVSVSRLKKKKQAGGLMELFMIKTAFYEK
jgi:hypothetical protein